MRPVLAKKYEAVSSHKGLCWGLRGRRLEIGVYSELRAEGENSLERRIWQSVGADSRHRIPT